MPRSWPLALSPCSVQWWHSSRFLVGKPAVDLPLGPKRCHLLVGAGAAAVGVVLGIATQLVAVGSMHAAVVDRAPHAVQRATGITMTGYYLGALAGPVGFGALVDWLDTYTWAWLAMAAGGAVGAAVFIRANRVGEVVP